VTRYVITDSGYKEFDRLTKKLARIGSTTPVVRKLPTEWYTTINELQVLQSYKDGETRRMTEASFKVGLVSAFERLLKKGFITSEEL